MTKIELEQAANKIAADIVAVVERTNGAVTLFQIEREIAAFAVTEGEPDWINTLTLGGDEIVLWDHLTEAGCLALNKVMRTGQVAVEFVSPLLYLLTEGRFLTHENWQPIFLLPAKEANLQTPRRLLRVTEEEKNDMLARAAGAGLSGYRCLRPAA